MIKVKVDEIEVEVISKKIKNLYLSVHPPDGAVRLSVPFRTSPERIQDFISKKKGWIRKQQTKFQGKKTLPEPTYVTGEGVLIWGKIYPLHVKETGEKKGLVQLQEGHLCLLAASGSSPEDRGALLKEWYRQELKEKIPPLLEKWQAIMGVKADQWGVKDMRTRWGTCNVKAKRIWLNLQLAKKPPECLEYVVVHELVHLLEKGHNAVFWGYMDQYLPDWKAIRKQLNEQS